MKWIYFPTEFFSGRENMEIDFSLARLNKSDCIFFRTYRWKPYCVSLGANQSFDILNFDELEKDAVDFVKRPTGGKAVFHAGELTYSIIHPTDNYYSPKKIYEDVNAALIEGLTFYHPSLKNLALESEATNLREEYKRKFSEACFSVPNKNELKFELKKLVGSAQRKIKNVVLQHGSILCGSEHLNLAKYLNIEMSERKLFLQKLNESTIELEAIVKEKINYHSLSDSIKLGMERRFNAKLEIGNPEDFIQLETAAVSN